MHMCSYVTFGSSLVCVRVISIHGHRHAHLFLSVLFLVSLYFVLKSFFHLSSWILPWCLMRIPWKIPCATPASGAWSAWTMSHPTQLKEHQRAAFFSPSENRCLPASSFQLEESEFVVDSGASTHMINKKDLSNAEMDTLTKSCSPVKVLDNTPAVLSFGKLCDENGYSYEWINGQKPHLIKDGIRIFCNTENFVPVVVPGLSNSSSGSSSTSQTPVKQESHSSSSSSSSLSLPTVGEIPVREREDTTNSDISPVWVCWCWIREIAGDPSQRNPKNQWKRDHDNTVRPVVFRQFWDSGMAARIQRKFGGWWNSITGRLSRQFFSWSEASLEPITKRSEDLGKHNVHTHFPKDRNCEICKRTKITRAPCRIRNGEDLELTILVTW